MKSKGFSIGIIFLVLMVCTTCTKDEALLTPNGESSALKGELVEYVDITVPDPSGGDDTDNIENALIQALVAGPGSVVQLAEGTYYITRNISLYGFDGYIKGAGKDKTAIEILPGAKIDGVPIWDQNLSSILTFYSGNIRISDLSFVVTDPVPAGKQDDNDDWWENALAWMILITVDDDSDSRNVSSSIDNVGFIGGPGNFFGYNIAHAVTIMHPDGIEGGSHSLTNCDFNYSVQTYQGYAINDYYHNGTWIVGGTSNSGNSFMNCRYGPFFQETKNSILEISYNTFEFIGRQSVVLSQNEDLEAKIESNNFAYCGSGTNIGNTVNSVVEILNNTIENCGSAIGVYGHDANLNGTEIKNNTISSVFYGIYLYGVHYVEVKNNNISTYENMPGIWVEWGSGFSPAIGNEIKSNTVEGGYIYVGAYALDNEIVNNSVNGAIDYFISDYESWPSEDKTWLWIPRPSNNYILVKEGDVIINENTCGNYICEAIDDDMDGFFDEDPYDQIDNDGDGRIDEDPIDIPNEITDVKGKPIKALEQFENDKVLKKHNEDKQKLLESKKIGFLK